MKIKPIQTKLFTIVFCFLLLLTVSAANAGTLKIAKCLSYEPASVILNGKLFRKVFLNASEQKETVWVLQLDAPVCIAADSANEFNPPIERVTDVQLVFNTEQLRKTKNFLNQKISVTGTLFAGHTQHHFTDVLLTVADIKKK